ncbi:MAG: hypothetical protein ACR2PS_00720, partial [Pseudomonadales bacterium]
MKARYLCTLVFTTLALLVASASADQNGLEFSRKAHKQVLHFDVAESGPKFVFDEAPLLPSSLPAYGNPFVTQGYIYP